MSLRMYCHRYPFYEYSAIKLLSGKWAILCETLVDVNSYDGAFLMENMQFKTKKEALNKISQLDSEQYWSRFQEV